MLHRPTQYAALAIAAYCIGHRSVLRAYERNRTENGGKGGTHPKSAIQHPRLTPWEGRKEHSAYPAQPLAQNDKPQSHRFISPKGEAHKRLFPAIFLFYPQKRTIPLSHSEENV